jgi:hypothetical protein
MRHSWIASLVVGVIVAMIGCSRPILRLDDADAVRLAAIREVSDGRRPVCIRVSPTLESNDTHPIDPSSALLDALQRDGWHPIPFSRCRGDQADLVMIELATPLSGQATAEVMTLASLPRSGSGTARLFLVRHEDSWSCDHRQEEFKTVFILTNPTSTTASKRRGP